MMKRFAAFAALFALTLPILNAGAPASLTPAERERLVQLLEQGRDRLLTAVAGLDDAAWNYRTAPDRWSAAQITEHLYKSEGLFQDSVEQFLSIPANPDWETATAAKTDMLESGMRDRSTKAQAPEPLKPGGEMSRADLIRAFAEARNETIRYVRETDKPIKQHVGDFGPFGPVNAMQVILLRGAHTLRHMEQLDEVLNSPGFPQ